MIYTQFDTVGYLNFESINKGNMYSRSSDFKNILGSEVSKISVGLFPF